MTWVKSLFKKGFLWLLLAGVSILGFLGWRRERRKRLEAETKVDVLVKQGERHTEAEVAVHTAEIAHDAVVVKSEVVYQETVKQAEQKIEEVQAAEPQAGQSAADFMNSLKEKGLL